MEQEQTNISLLSNIIIYMKYAKYTDDEFREKESWKDLVDRNKQMHLDKFPNLVDEIEQNYRLIYDRKVLPSMRSLQFGGKAIEVNPTRMYNCCYLAIDNPKCFSEIMFLLLSGCGVGFSVQTQHVAKLPYIKKPIKTRNRRFLINDSIEGWADAIKALMKSYFNGTSTLVFDYRSIRPRGSVLKTSGGLSPGSQGLKEAILKITGILEMKENGEQLSSLEVHDIICLISSAVLSGGIRRSATISLFSKNDDDMFTCKTGDDWYSTHPHRCHANNSVVLNRNDTTEEEFKLIWKKIFAINNGEPGVYLTNDTELGANPCCEISLNSNQFCNLVEINTGDVLNEEDYIERCKTASFIATLQSSYTDFHYLRTCYKRVTEKERLLGVGMTGLAYNKVTPKMMKNGAKEVIKENKRVSELLGINESYRTTTIKPSGTSSLVLGTSSGIHAAYDRYYIRRVRINKTEPIYEKILSIVPDLIEDDFIRAHDTAVLSIPIFTDSDTAIYRNNETSLEFLERIKTTYINWIKPGHRRGSNRNNISSTIFVKEHERDDVINWLYENKDFYNGLTVFPYMESDAVYVQTPFESIDEETYHRLNSFIIEKQCELNNVFNNMSAPNSTHGDENFITNDYNLSLEPACFGGKCDM